jgi:uncharacterized protein (TIGR00730 family)
MGHKLVAIFGGSRVEKRTPEYEEAFQTGKLLAAAGYHVMNGGYGGTMEASARGAKDNGGRAIGILSGEFRSLSPNRFLSEMIVRADLFDRIREMHTRADAFIVLKGSMGTLAELALVWNLSKLDEKHRKPIVLVGDAWDRVLKSWRADLSVTDDEAELLQLVKTPNDAVELLRRTFDGRGDPFPLRK